MFSDEVNYNKLSYHLHIILTISFQQYVEVAVTMSVVTVRILGSVSAGQGGVAPTVNSAYARMEAPVW